MIPREVSVILPYGVEKPKGAVVMLTGRGNSCHYANEFMVDLGLEESLLMSIRPYGYEWYPAPRSSFDQDEAVKGLKPARIGINKVLDRFQKLWDIPREETVLMGFSAGGVMAIETAMFSDTPFKSVVCCGGAILDTQRVPKCKHPDMPIILQHNRDDFCFDWWERYVPMRKELQKKKYKIRTLERDWGNHHISRREALPIGKFLAGELGYGDDWIHPSFREKK